MFNCTPLYFQANTARWGPSWVAFPKFNIRDIMQFDITKDRVIIKYFPNSEVAYNLAFIAGKFPYQDNDIRAIKARRITTSFVNRFAEATYEITVDMTLGEFIHSQQED